MATKLNIEVDEIFNGTDTRTIVTIRPKDYDIDSPSVRFVLEKETVDLSPGGSAGGDVRKENLPFVRDAVEFIITYLS